MEKALATEKRGQMFGFIVALTSVMAGLILGVLGILLNSTVAVNLAIAFVSFPLVGIVGIFVTGRLIGRNENIEKTKILAGKSPELQ